MSFLGSISRRLWRWATSTPRARWMEASFASARASITDLPDPLAPMTRTWPAASRLGVGQRTGTPSPSRPRTTPETASVGLLGTSNARSHRKKAATAPSA